MRSLFFPVTLAATLLLLTLAAFNQSNIVTNTMPVAIDGITRTVTVSFVPTGVISISVKPVTSNFDSTAIQWLDSLYAVFGDMQLNDDLPVRSASITLDSLFKATDMAMYPLQYKPFVRQYRFAIHTCRNLVDFRSQSMSSGKDADFVSVGVYATLYTACYEQYQDAYVELERTTAQLSELLQ